MSTEKDQARKENQFRHRKLKCLNEKKRCYTQAKPRPYQRPNIKTIIMTMQLKLTPVGKKSSNYGKGYCQLFKDRVFNARKHFSDDHHMITIREMADLQTELDPITGIRTATIHSTPNRRYNDDSYNTLCRDVTDRYQSPELASRLLPKRGTKLGHLAPRSIYVIMATEFWGEDGSLCLKAAFAAGGRVYTVTSDYEGCNTQESQADGYYLWKTGMQAPQGWWLAVKYICEDMLAQDAVNEGRMTMAEYYGHIGPEYQYESDPEWIYNNCYD
jgi:hypothetical protein